MAKQIPGCERGFGANRSAFVVDSKEIAAGVVFHNWSPTSEVIEVSAAAVNPKWATRSVLKDLFDYAYDGCGCQMVIARISAKNERARRLWRAFGASEYIIPRLRGRNENEAILTLTQEAWSASKFRGKRDG